MKWILFYTVSPSGPLKQYESCIPTGWIGCKIYKPHSNGLDLLRFRNENLVVGQSFYPRQLLRGLTNAGPKIIFVLVHTILINVTIISFQAEHIRPLVVTMIVETHKYGVDELDCTTESIQRLRLF
jgi:hypothetical protein